MSGAREGGAPRRTARGRSALLAAVLSGLGPGAGHAYVRRPARGVALLVLLAGTSLWWTVVAPRSYDQARMFALPPLLLVLAIIVDAARLARRSARPFALAPWQRWWTYVAIVAVTGFLAPAALAEALRTQAGTVLAQDDALEPSVHQGDVLVVEKRARLDDLRRGDVVAVARPGRPPALRRVVALPGESVAVQRGVAWIDGSLWAADSARVSRGRDLDLPEVTVGPERVLALTDRRVIDEASGAMVDARLLQGRASYILLPEDWDVLRVGARP